MVTVKCFEDNTPVKAALDRIRSSWKKQYEATSKSDAINSESDATTGIADPLVSLKALLLDRRAILENCTTDNMPDWLQRAREKSAKVEKKRKRKRLSTAELEKLERAKERSSMLKEDLEKAQAYKRQCQARLRELEKKKQDDKAKVHSSRSKNRVRWKDGLSSLTGGRNRIMLEEVLMIEGRNIKDKAPAV